MTPGGAGGAPAEREAEPPRADGKGGGLPWPVFLGLLGAVAVLGGLAVVLGRRRRAA